MTIRTSEPNESRCGLCSAAPPDQFRRPRLAEGGRALGRYVCRRTNRHRMDAGFVAFYADRLRRDGFAIEALVGKLVCQNCHRKILATVNTP